MRIYDLGVSDDHAHIAMEYLPGGDLRAPALENGILERDAVEYTRQISSAIANLHSVGILHRDLKPGNIMLREDGSIALIDFGLAKRTARKQDITGRGEIIGTPYYMSPEQGRGYEVDERSDVYSLGIMFYEMLTGERPYGGANAMGLIFKHREAPVPVLSRQFEPVPAAHQQVAGEETAGPDSKCGRDCRVAVMHPVPANIAAFFDTPTPDKWIREARQAIAGVAAGSCEL